MWWLCTDILINDISIKDEINLDSEKQYYCWAINFSAMKGDL